MLGLSDEELIRRCKIELPGDTRSYEVLVQRHGTKVYSLVYRVIGSREEAEDITQEVFLKVYHGLGKFEQQAAFSTWLYRVATNTALDALDKLKRRPNFKVQSTTPASEVEDQHWLIFQASHGNTNPEDIISRAELRNCIAGVFTSLEREQATVLIMRDVNNLSYQEIASTTRLGLSAIKMRIHRARVSFQTLFRSLCDPDFGKTPVGEPKA